MFHRKKNYVKPINNTRTRIFDILQMNKQFYIYYDIENLFETLDPTRRRSLVDVKFIEVFAVKYVKGRRITLKETNVICL